MFRFSLVLVFLLSACGQPTTSETRGLDTENSNISFDGTGDVERIRVEPNTRIPKGVLVSLTSYTRNFVLDLYDLIYAINVAEGLSGLEGIDQEISLVLSNSSV